MEMLGFLVKMLRFLVEMLRFSEQMLRFSAEMLRFLVKMLRFLVEMFKFPVKLQFSCENGFIWQKIINDAKTILIEKYVLASVGLMNRFRTCH